MRGGSIERNVNAADVQVARNILPEVRELQCGASGIGQTLTLLVAVAAEIQDQASHGICRIYAITEDGLPVRITLDGLILTESFQEVRERLPGNIFCDYRLAQRDEHRMGWLAFVASIQLMFPPGEQFQRARRIGNFVAKIVGPAAVGVDVVEMLMQGLGEEPRNDVEIFVMVRRKPARVPFGYFGRAAGLRRVFGDFDFAGTQH